MMGGRRRRDVGRKEEIWRERRKEGERERGREGKRERWREREKEGAGGEDEVATLQDSLQ